MITSRLLQIIISCHPLHLECRPFNKVPPQIIKIQKTINMHTIHTYHHHRHLKLLDTLPTIMSIIDTLLTIHRTKSTMATRILITQILAISMLMHTQIHSIPKDIFLLMFKDITLSALVTLTNLLTLIILVNLTILTIFRVYHLLTQEKIIHIIPLIMIQISFIMATHIQAILK